MWVAYDTGSCQKLFCILDSKTGELEALRQAGTLEAPIHDENGNEIVNAKFVLSYLDDDSGINVRFDESAEPYRLNKISAIIDRESYRRLSSDGSICDSYGGRKLFRIDVRDLERVKVIF